MLRYGSNWACNGYKEKVSIGEGSICSKGAGDLHLTRMPGHRLEKKETF